MDKDSNLKHWDEWAESHGVSLLATTKCLTIKKIEIMALARTFRRYLPGNSARILELGCGNGINVSQLSGQFPDYDFYGLDFSRKMIDNAIKGAGSVENSGSSGRVHFGVMDARELALPLSFDDETETVEKFDAVFTNRMLINLASSEEQLQVMRKIAGILRPGGLFLMMENSVQSHARVNEVRLALGLTARERASYNIFIDEQTLIKPFMREMKLLETEYISAIHDLMLYGVCPALADGEIVYDTPIMKILSEAIIQMGELGVKMPSGFGQGVLWVWQKSGEVTN